MAMRQLVERLRDAFARNGWSVSVDVELEGRSGQVHAVPLLAEWDGQAIVLDVADAETLEPEQVEAFASSVADTGADRGILAFPGERAAPSVGNVVVWDRAALSRVLGELALADMVGGAVTLPLDAEHAAPAVAPTAAPSPEPEMGLDAILPTAFLDPEPQLPVLEPAPPAPTPAPTPAATPPGPFGSLLASLPPPAAPPPTPYAPVATRATPAAAFTPFTTGKPTMPVRLLEAEAAAKVADRLFGVERVELVLQPVHLFDYEVDILHKGKLAYDTLEGQLQVNASDKAARDVDPDVANPEAPTRLPAGHGHPVTERVVRVTPERALELAFRYLAVKHTRTVELRVPDHRNGVFYTERKKVEPTKDQVRLTARGIVLRPLWRLWGSNGHVDVDANDGTVGWAETVRSHTDAMLLD